MGQTSSHTDSRQLAARFYVVFLQGSLTVPVGWGHFEVILRSILGHFEPFAGCTLVQVLLSILIEQRAVERSKVEK